MILEQERVIIVYYDLPMGLLLEHGIDILSSQNMLREKSFIQHGGLSCYDHSLFVAYMSLVIAKKMRLNVDVRSLIRGALLHDYFLYDWHVPSSSNRNHAFKHPHYAYENARVDFNLNEKERDIILKHMFPLTVKPPRFKESYIVMLADKYCAVYETLAVNRMKMKAEILNSYLENTIKITREKRE